MRIDFDFFSTLKKKIQRIRKLSSLSNEEYSKIFYAVNTPLTLEEFYSALEAGEIVYGKTEVTDSNYSFLMEYVAKFVKKHGYVMQLNYSSDLSKEVMISAAKHILKDAGFSFQKNR